MLEIVLKTARGLKGGHRGKWEMFVPVLKQENGLQERRTSTNCNLSLLKLS